MDQHGIKRHLSRLLDAAEHHAHNPERNDIISGHESIGGIKIFHFFCFIRPSQRGKWPQRRTEPGIQSIGILPHFLAAFWTEGLHFPLSLTSSPQSSRSKMQGSDAPPELPGYTPVPDVFQPVEIGLVKMIGNKRVSPFLQVIDRLSPAKGFIFTNHCLLTLGSTVVPQR